MFSVTFARVLSIGGNRKTQSIALFKRHLGKHHAQLYKDLYKEPDVAEEKSDGTPKKRKAEEEAEDPNTPCTDKARSKKARQTLFQKTIPQVVQAFALSLHKSSKIPQSSC